MSAQTQATAIAELPEEFRQAVSLVGGILAPLFLYEPQEGAARAVVQQLAAADALQLAQEWPFVSADQALASLREMQRGLAEEDADSLMWEYRRLFVGPEAKAVPPWSSVYLDRDGIIFGSSHTELVGFMRANGIRRNADSSTPCDHIGLMLELMAWIAEKRPELLAEYLEKHLLTWAGHFLAEMGEATASAFYRGLATLARQTLEALRVEMGIPQSFPLYFR